MVVLGYQGLLQPMGGLLFLGGLCGRPKERYPSFRIALSYLQGYSFEPWRESPQNLLAFVDMQKTAPSEGGYTVIKRMRVSVTPEKERGMRTLVTRSCLERGGSQRGAPDL